MCETGHLNRHSTAELGMSQRSRVTSLPVADEKFTTLTPVGAQPAATSPDEDWPEEKRPGTKFCPAVMTAACPHVLPAPR